MFLFASNDLHLKKERRVDRPRDRNRKKIKEIRTKGVSYPSTVGGCGDGDRQTRTGDFCLKGTKIWNYGRTYSIRPLAMDVHLQDSISSSEVQQRSTFSVRRRHTFLEVIKRHLFKSASPGFHNYVTWIQISFSLFYSYMVRRLRGLTLMLASQESSPGSDLMINWVWVRFLNKLIVS